jgi:tRNA (uracil-5-)-methyltransferase TRM9
MNARTVAALDRINQRFYSQCAEAFDETRSRPWRGWDRAISGFCDGLSQVEGQTDTRAILDAGCGNGRFGLYLSTRLAGPMRYRGLDESAAMLRLAHRRMYGIGSIDLDLRQCDVAECDSQALTDGERFDLAAAFGLLHHVPGFDRRLRLVRRLSEALTPEGTLLISFWQFGDRQRFRRRFIDWSEHNRSAEEPIDLEDLEEGDYLLAWGEGELTSRRYCHFASEDEAQRLVEASRLRVLDCYLSDGLSNDLNLYFVLKRSV